MHYSQSENGDGASPPAPHLLPHPQVLPQMHLPSLLYLFPLSLSPRKSRYDPVKKHIHPPQPYTPGNPEETVLQRQSWK